MRAPPRGQASVRAVLATVLLVVSVAAIGGWWGYRSIVLAERAPLPSTPPPVVLEAVPVTVMPEIMPDTRDPIEAAWCDRGPEAVVKATEGASAEGAATSESAMRTAILRAEALLALGRVADALAWNESLCQALARPTPAQPCEPLALEQHARIRMAAGETNLLKQEDRLRASIEGRQLVSATVPAEAWATLATLEKARGACGLAIEHYATALQGLDVNGWLALRRSAPWRMQLLALVALDRADCLATLDRDEEARKSAIQIAADLATALGEADPLAQQAADLRDQLISGR
jgi:hypothetical protein